MTNALSRKKDYLNNLLRNLATSLILYEEIKTTKAKAKAVKPLVERLIIIAQKNDLNARRRMKAELFDMNAVKKMFEVIGPRYKALKNGRSGFIKTYHLGPRLGDGAEMFLMRLKSVQEKEITKPKEAENEKERKEKQARPGKKTASTKKS